MRVPVLTALVFAFLPVLLISVSAEPEFFVVTERGNVFPIKIESGNGEGGDGGGDGGDGGDDSNGGSTAEEVRDSISVGLSMVYDEVNGHMFVGDAGDSYEESITPYMDLDQSADFFVVARTLTDTATIPIFYETHNYNHMRSNSILAHKVAIDGTRSLSGDVTITKSDNKGITFSGDGRTVLKIRDPNPELGLKWVVSGNLAEGSKVRIVQSPYDLMNVPHGSNGFLINTVLRDPGRNGVSVLAGSVEDSDKTAVISYSQSASFDVYRNKCCRNLHTQTYSNDVSRESVPRHDGYSDGYEVVTDNSRPSRANLDAVTKSWERVRETHYNRVSDVKHRVYDTLPVKELHSFILTENGLIPPLVGTTYLVIDSTDDTSSIHMSPYHPHRPTIGINGLPPDAGYRILRDGNTMNVGLVSDAGGMFFRDLGENKFAEKPGTIELFRGALHYEGDTERTHFVLDNMNNQVIPLPSTKSSLYHAQAYVKVPIPSSVSISNVTLTGTDKKVSLPYLVGDYVGGDSMLIPIIPGYKTIHLGIEDITATFNIVDISAQQIRIFEGSTTKTTLYKTHFISSISSTTGATASFVATHDGTLKTVVEAKVSGSASIGNYRHYVIIPPPPPPDPPRPRDPLETWVSVYINGQLTPINGEDSTQIHFSDTPKITKKATSGRHSSSAILGYSYDPITVSHLLSIPVQTGDLVEVHFFNKVEGFGSSPVLPEHAREIRRAGSAQATAVLDYAAITFSP